MKFTDNAINILAAKIYKGIGTAWIVQNIHSNMTIEEIVKKLNIKLKDSPTSIIEFQRYKNTIIERIKNIEPFVDGITAMGDVDFPHIRGSVKDSEKPVILYYKGNLSLLSKHNRNIAVIGLLTPDDYTIKEESDIVRKLVAKQYNIVSGLALGCDSVAHKETLLQKGKTIAILPSPIQNILPKQNQQLAEQIIQAGGLLISEYGKDAVSNIELRSRYQERDRLQALFSDGIILSASYSKKDIGCDSGSRLAMNYAKEYQLPRFVMYDEQRDKDNPKYNLTRELIQDRGVSIVTPLNVETKVSNRLANTSYNPPIQLDIFN